MWHCRIAEREVPGARYYAYRVDGPRCEPGHGFDPDKVLHDPWSRGLHFPPRFERDAAIGPGPNDGRAPVGVLPPPGPGSGTAAPDHAPADEAGPPPAEVRRTGREELVVERLVAPARATPSGAGGVLYKLHVRGFTRGPGADVAPENRGTFRGLMEKIPYLRDLGVTAVELLPVFPVDPQSGDYWGYMPLNLFSVRDELASAEGVGPAFLEFREMVRAFHRAGIEVILDMVLDHTGEGGADGPTYSYRGIDRSTYYLLTPDRRGYRDDTGCGNTLRCHHPVVRRLITDSLRFWVREGEVDGFRFDLASIFSRNPDGSLNLDGPPLISDIMGAPELEGIRLIADAWDGGSHQLGRSFPGVTWHQGNGRFRDDVRAFLRGEPGMVPLLMTRVYGSDDLFPDTLSTAFRPFQSVNYVTSHDGFTLRDLLTYRRPIDPESAPGGGREHRSWNRGWEGEEDPPESVCHLRLRQARNFMAVLLLSAGTPMIRAGDEFLQTQGGRANPWNRDDEGSWLDWRLLEEHAGLHRFVRALIRLRRGHPLLSDTLFWRERVRWHGEGPAGRGRPDFSPGSRAFAYALIAEEVGVPDLYVMLNASRQRRSFVIHEGAPGEWRRLVDTALGSPDDVVDEPLDPAAGPCIQGERYALAPHSLVVLQRTRTSR